MAQQHPGRLEVVCGSMFSGKSEEVIRRLRRAEFARIETQVFKHSLDGRKTTTHIHAHSGDALEAHPISSPDELEAQMNPNTQVVGIDEVQFFPCDIITTIEHLVSRGCRVIVAGLDLDFRGMPFGCMPALLALADDITKLKAVCTQSGHDAHFTQRLVDSKPAKHDDPLIQVGAEECYEARARHCFEIDYRPLREYVAQLQQTTQE